jgi:hypothetical protein
LSSSTSGDSHERTGRTTLGAAAPGRGSIGTWAIESGVQASYLVVMGTSIRELEDTYFRWLRRTDDQFRAVFDEYDARAAV